MPKEKDGWRNAAASRNEQKQQRRKGRRKTIRYKWLDDKRGSAQLECEEKTQDNVPNQKKSRKEAPNQEIVTL
jgi:hypothetical protein